MRGFRLLQRTPVSGVTRRRSSPRLALQLVAHEIRTGDAGSVLGLGWIVFQPLAFVGGYWFLLTVLRAQIGAPEGADELEILVLVSGLIPWLFVSRSVGGAVGVLTQRAALIKQVNFPTGVLPFVNVGVHGLDLLVGLVVLSVIVTVTGNLSWSLGLLLPASAFLACFLVAVTTMLAPLGVMLRDLRRVVQLAVRIGLFITPVLYLPAALPDSVEIVAYLNPISWFISVVRFAATDSHDALLVSVSADLAIAAGITATMAAVAYLAHSRAHRTVLDHI